MKDKLENLGLSVTQDHYGMLIINPETGQNMRLTRELLLSVGTMMSSTDHTEDCWTNFADYVPSNSRCGCPVTELGILTEEGILSTVMQQFRLVTRRRETFRV